MVADGVGGGGRQGVEQVLLGVVGSGVGVQVRENFSVDDSEDINFVFRADVEKVFCEGLSCTEVAM